MLTDALLTWEVCTYAEHVVRVRPVLWDLLKARIDKVPKVIRPGGENGARQGQNKTRKRHDNHHSVNKLTEWKKKQNSVLWYM